MSDGRTIRRLLLAGSLADERQPARRDTLLARWFEPAHVREPSVARARIAAQVAAGADVVVAPAWQSHRRALVDVGETRRAREWTLDAVAVAREGVEVGLEDRERQSLPEPADQEAASPPKNRSMSRPTPLVAGPLPVLEGETGAGRLLPRDAASERDHRDQAGILADADVDLILVEVDPGTAMARVAVDAALDTGLPIWVAAIPPRGTGTSLAEMERWAEEAFAGGAELILAPAPGLAATENAQDAVPPTPPEAAIAEMAAILARAAGEAWGGMVGTGGRVREEADAWLTAGARVLGLLAGADSEALSRVRAAIDASEDEERSRLEASEARARETVSRAARMAAGGPALWLSGSAQDWLPTGFDWHVVTPSEARHLPPGRYRLIVAAEAFAEAAEPDIVADRIDLDDLARLMDAGGILVHAFRPDGGSHSLLRLIHVDDAIDPPSAIWRREG